MGGFRSAALCDQAQKRKAGFRAGLYLWAGAQCDLPFLDMLCYLSLWWFFGCYFLSYSSVALLRHGNLSRCVRSVGAKMGKDSHTLRFWAAVRMGLPRMGPGLCNFRISVGKSG